MLDQLEEWTYQIYSAAGLCCKSNSSDGSAVSVAPAMENSSRPDQPASHICPVVSSDDPLSGVKIPCFDDQLTRVRLAGAKDLQAGCHSASQRLDHLYPFCIVDWHTKRSYLKVFMDKFKTVFKLRQFELWTIGVYLLLFKIKSISRALSHSSKIDIKYSSLKPNLIISMQHTTNCWTYYYSSQLFTDLIFVPRSVTQATLQWFWTKEFTYSN